MLTRIVKQALNKNLYRTKPVLSYNTRLHSSLPKTYMLQHITMSGALSFDQVVVNQDYHLLFKLESFIDSQGGMVICEINSSNEIYLKRSILSRILSKTTKEELEKWSPYSLAPYNIIYKLDHMPKNYKEKAGRLTMSFAGKTIELDPTGSFEALAGAYMHTSKELEKYPYSQNEYEENTVANNNQGFFAREVITTTGKNKVTQFLKGVIDENNIKLRRAHNFRERILGQESISIVHTTFSPNFRDLVKCSRKSKEATSSLA